MEYVILANGEKVDWDEFSRWNCFKQTISLRPLCRKAEIGDKARSARRDAIQNGSFIPLKGDRHVSSKKVISPDGEFSSLVEAAHFYCVAPTTISAWVRGRRPGFSFGSGGVPRQDGKHPTAIRIKTPDGVFDSISACARHYGVLYQIMRYRVNSKNFPEFQAVTKK